MTLYYPESVPPRERIFFAGPSALTDAELIALLIGTGRVGEDVFQLARLTLERLGGLRALSESHPSELLGIPGFGRAKATRIFAAVELGRRICGQRWELGEPFSSSRQVFSHYHYRLRDQKRELFIVAFLDSRHRLIGEQEISRGSLVASIVHPREVFRAAIRTAAASVICVHNHPSGDPTLSHEDLAITRRLHRAGQTIGIEVVDHVIIGDGEYCSFVDAGIPPFHTVPGADGGSGLTLKTDLCYPPPMV